MNRDFEQELSVVGPLTRPHPGAKNPWDRYTGKGHSRQIHAQTGLDNRDLEKELEWTESFGKTARMGTQGLAE